MDVINIKYNHELFKMKIGLEKSLKWLEQDIEKHQKDCKHIRVFFSREQSDLKPGGFKLERCLFCGKESISESYPLINATTYRRRFKRVFGEEKTIESSIKFLQEFCIRMLNENPNLTEEELIEKVHQEIEKDEEENQKDESYQKKLNNLI